MLLEIKSEPAGVALRFDTVITFSNSFSWISSMLWILFITSLKGSACTQHSGGLALAPTNRRRRNKQPEWAWHGQPVPPSLDTGVTNYNAPGESSARTEFRKSRRPPCGNVQLESASRSPYPGRPGPEGSPEKTQARFQRRALTFRASAEHIEKETNQTIMTILSRVTEGGEEKGGGV